MAVIDEVGASFENLHPDYRGRTIEGEVLSEEVLKRAGIETADGLAAVTNLDSVNAVVGHVARTIYSVPRVVVRNYNPRWLPMHHAFGLAGGELHRLGRAADRGDAGRAAGPRRVLRRQRGGRAARDRGAGEVGAAPAGRAGWAGTPSPPP